MDTLMVLPNLRNATVKYGPARGPDHVSTMNDECVREIGAFARGGKCGLERLRAVYPNILKEYKVASEELDGVLWQAGLRMHMGKIKPL